jgi:hypothetical protein
MRQKHAARCLLARLHAPSFGSRGCADATHNANWCRRLRASGKSPRGAASIASPARCDRLGSRGLLTLRAFVAGILLLGALPAQAAEDGTPASGFRAPWWGPESSVLYGGFYGLRGPQKWEDVFAGLEIRGGPFWWELRLITGALAASDGNAFAYVGVLADMPISFVHLIVSFAPGASSSGTDHYLGFPLIFRSTAEIAFAITPRTRLGISFSHMSNGKLAAPNPGVETLSLTFTVLALPY